jgi:cytochrome c oxidase subunit 2
VNLAFHLLPAGASTYAQHFDRLFFALLALCGGVFIILTCALFYFSIRYRRGKEADRHQPLLRSRALEITWIIVPLAIFIGIFFWAANLYGSLYTSPNDAVPVFVVAKQWMWTLQHPNGKREINELHVPLGLPIKLVMTSQDVIHSFFVPAFRIKQDVVPGRYTSIVFTPTQLGEYHLFCAEYCGTEHSRMGGRVIVMLPADFARWLDAGASTRLAARGRQLFFQFGCNGCHDTRSTVHAPDLSHVFGSSVHLSDGRSVIADDNYLRDSIVEPGKDIVAGFAPVMPSFKNQISEDELISLIEYLRNGIADDASQRDSHE